MSYILYILINMLENRVRICVKKIPRKTFIFIIQKNIKWEMVLDDRKKIANNFYKKLRIVNPNGENVLVNNRCFLFYFLFGSFQN